MKNHVVIKLLMALIATATLTACADAIQEDIGECEPGVGSLSRTIDSAPPAAC